MPDIVSC